MIKVWKVPLWSTTVTAVLQWFSFSYIKIASRFRWARSGNLKVFAWAFSVAFIWPAQFVWVHSQNVQLANLGTSPQSQLAINLKIVSQWCKWLYQSVSCEATLLQASIVSVWGRIIIVLVRMRLRHRHSLCCILRHPCHLMSLQHFLTVIIHCVTTPVFYHCRLHHLSFLSIHHTWL